MTRAPADRSTSEATSPAALSLAAVTLAFLTASGGCSLNTAGINDLPTTGRGAGGDLTGVHTGVGGGPVGGSTGNGLGGGGATGSASGGSTGSVGAGGTPDDGTGGTAGVGGETGTNGMGGATGAGGTTGTGGATGVGGTTGVGGATGVGGMGTGGRVGTGGVMGTGGMMGTGGVVVVSPIGCSDGSREAFISTTTFPDIAGCAGGWSVPGVLTTASMTPACNRAAGNDGARPAGTGCSVEDLCAAGWHVCRGATELDDMGVTCAQARLPAAITGALLYITRQRGVQGNTCNADDTTGTNDVHGCGNVGLPEDNNCAPLDRHFSHTECDLFGPPWACGDNNTATTEGNLVTKPGSLFGGVLCCR